jgi:hypothetical protein
MNDRAAHLAPTRTSVDCVDDSAPDGRALADWNPDTLVTPTHPRAGSNFVRVLTRKVSNLGAVRTEFFKSLAGN